MSLLLIFLVSAFLLIIFSQFGQRFAARNALAWWCISLFLFLAAIDPEIFRPLTNLLGIALISNFVLATMIMFLLLQLVELSVDSTSQSRKFRDLVSRSAAEDFVESMQDRVENERGVKVLVVLPCYNEEAALPSTIKHLKEAMALENVNFRIRYCFVDDGSVDETPSILGRECPKLFTRHRANIGVSGALLTGFHIAKILDYDYVVQCDSDGQHPIALVPSLVAFAVKNNLDLVVGSRFAGEHSIENAAESTTWKRLVGIVLLRQILRLFGRKAAIFDPTSGFRVYSKLARNILTKQMPDEYPEPETIAILSLKSARIAEFRVDMQPRAAGVSTLNGVRSARFMVKVISALVGLRIRSFRS